MREVLVALEQVQARSGKPVVDEFSSRASEMYDLILNLELANPDIVNDDDRLTVQQIRQEQENDRWCRHMYEHLKSDGVRVPSDSLQAESIIAGAPHYNIDPHTKLLMRVYRC